MPLYHFFSSTIADSAAAIAAGKVVPTAWNHEHVLVGAANAVLFNNNASVATDPNLTYNPASHELTVGAVVALYAKSSFANLDVLDTASAKLFAAGAANSLQGQLAFFHQGSPYPTILQAGVATEAATYTLPPKKGGPNSVLTDFAGTGTLSWQPAGSGPQGSQGELGAQGPQGSQGPQGFQGQLGTQGAAGTQGINGTQGPQGFQGNAGAQGNQGGVGAQGAQGTTGSTGIAGAQGAQGTQGVQGAAGLAGPQGDVGNQGPQGFTGNIGLTGAQGAQGPQGPAGNQGLTGPQGAFGGSGPQGVTGPQGVQGVQGAVGFQGPQGLVGVTGTQGTQGPIGAQGAQGAQGATGAQGFQGLTGASANVFYYQADANGTSLADPGAGKMRWDNATQQAATNLVFDRLTSDGFDVLAYFRTTEINDELVIQEKDFSYNFQTWRKTGPGEEGPDFFWVPVVFVASGGAGTFTHNSRLAVLIKSGGAQGPIGPQGAQGQNGSQGPQGITGAQGFTGSQGPTGAQGLPGLTGPQGPTGSQGPGGANGNQGPAGSNGTQGPAGTQGAQGGPGRFTISATPPASPTHGDTWWDSDDGISYIYFNDGNSAQWVAFIGSPGPQGPQGAAGSTVISEVPGAFTFTASAAALVVTLTWTASTKALVYRVMRDGALVATVSAPALTYTETVAAGTYAYTVQAVNGVIGMSSSSNPQSVTAVSGPTPSFNAPLLTTLTPSVAGDPSFTFTRTTTAYVTAVAANGNAVDGQVSILCAVNEARFQGARRVAQGVWSALYADGSAIPAANLLGLVVENGVTNLALQSQALDNASWVKQTMTVAADTTTAPDGTLSADTLTATNTNSFLTQLCAVTNLPWAFSIWLKRKTGTGPVGLTVDGNTLTAVASQINSTTWTRVFTSTTPTAGNKSTGIRIDTPGDAVYAWGAQLEQSAVPTTYIPTTTATVARGEDVLTYPLIGNLNGATGSTYCELSLPYLAPITRVTFRTTGPPVGAPQYVQATPAALTFFAQGANKATVANTASLGTNKCASAWSGTTVSLCANGGTVATGTFTAPCYPTSGSVVIGSAPDAPGNTIQGTIRNVNFYSGRLTDAQLQTMTA